MYKRQLSYRKITWANQSSDNVTFHMGKTAQFIGDFNVVADDLYPRIGQAFRQFEAGESLALEMINAFSVERAFISCDALSLETGITNATMFEVGVKTRIIQRSREVILMADHSKFDAVEPHAVATLSCIKTIISDSGLPETIAQRYQRAGCQLFLPHSIK